MATVLVDLIVAKHAKITLDNPGPQVSLDFIYEERNEKSNYSGDDFL